jgi:hypothetical protein
MIPRTPPILKMRFTGRLPHATDFEDAVHRTLTQVVDEKERGSLIRLRRT